MKYLLALFFLILSLGQLTRLELLGSRFNIFGFEIIMAIIVIILLFKSGISAVYRPGIVFISILTLSIFNNFRIYEFNQNLIGIFYLLRLIFYLVFCHFLLMSLEKSLIKRVDIDYGLNIFIYLTIILNIVQYFLYPNLRNLVYKGWDPHWYRIFGTYLDPNITGIILLILIVYKISNLKFYRKKIFIDKNIILILLLVIQLLLTYSRITYIAAIIWFIIFGIKYYSKKTVAMIIAIFFILLIVLPRPFGASVKLERSFSIVSRAVDLATGYNIWKDNPLIGVGYNRIGAYEQNNSQFPNHAQSGFSSSFIIILVSSGALGIAGFLYLLFSIFSKLNYQQRALMISILSVSIIENIILVNFIFITLFFAMLLLNKRSKVDNK